MAKYIDAEKLIALLEQRKMQLAQWTDKEYANQRIDEIDCILDVDIDSLQQEQSESLKGKFVFPKFLYVRTVDNKTIDVSYAPQSLDAVEYIKNDSTEQSDVDLKKEIKEWTDLMVGAWFPEQDGDFISEEDYRSVIRQTAIHFFEGYEQAEKDLALTWKDMKRIIRIDEEMMDDPDVHPEWKEEQPYYEEVLRRFDKAKEEKK